MKLLDKNGEEIRIRNIVRFKSWEGYSSKPRMVEGRVVQITSQDSWNWRTGHNTISTSLSVRAKEGHKIWIATIRNFKNVEVLKLSCFNNED